MHDILYLNNFRGFADSLIRLQRVNFLVGENSTGKSSVLGILKLLSSPNFWLNQDFSAEGVKFGHFEDLVSRASEDKSFFQIGMIRNENASKTVARPDLTAFLMTFTSREDQAQLSRFTGHYRNKIIELALSHDTLSCRITSSKGPSAATTSGAKTMKSWAAAHRKPARGFRKMVTLREQYRGARAIVPIPVFVAQAEALLEAEKASDQKTISLLNAVSRKEIVWIAPIRSKPQRTYDAMNLTFSPEGGHTPYVIRRMLDSSAETKRFTGFLKKVGAESGLFSGIQVKSYGDTKTSPFEIDILLDGKAFNMDSVGYGVSQSLPVLVELFAQPKEASFAIQQPEVHLHPRAQAAMGDVLYEVASTDRKHFFIETHSDYMIDRFRYAYGKAKESSFSAQVLFFERSSGRNQISEIEIESDGSLSSDQPESYRRFFIKEELAQLSL